MFCINIISFSLCMHEGADADIGTGIGIGENKMLYKYLMELLLNNNE